MPCSLKHTSTSPCTVQLYRSNLWRRRLIHYSGNMGLNWFPALIAHLSPASSPSQINIPHREQRAQPHEQVFMSIWQNSLHLSWFRVSHKHTLIPKSPLSLFQFQTTGKEPAQALRHNGLLNRSCVVWRQHLAEKTEWKWTMCFKDPRVFSVCS